jgi:hypothetical protein
VLRLLRSKFVCGWRNIEGQEPYAGTSNDHAPSNPAVTTTNGAGHHNIQMIFYARDGVVLHCLPGYWDGDALAGEMDLALALDAIHADASLTPREKNEKFIEAQLGHVALHRRAGTMARSRLQSFDAWQEQRRPGTDFTRAAGGSDLKTVDQVVHERMAARPFLRREDFDLAAYIEMGIRQYDAHNDGCMTVSRKVVCR